MKKKVISLMIIGAMVASLAACGSSGDSSSTEGNGSAETEASSGDSTSSGEGLTIWTWDPSFNIPSMETAIDIYKAVHEDFEANIVETLSEDCETKLINAAESGDLQTLPDICLMQDNSFQKFVSTYPEAFVDLTDSGIDFSQFTAGKLAYSTVDGKNYGVPFDNGAVVGCYRTDILAQAGYTVDDLTDITWDRFIEIGKDLYEKTGVYLLSGQADSPDTIMMMLQSAGGSLFNEDGTPNMVDNDCLNECIDLYIQMVENKVYYEVNSWDEYISSITTGNVAGVINGNWITPTIETMEDTSGNWAMTNMPALISTPGATNYSNNGGSSWYISTNCQDVDLAIDFLANTFAGSTELYDTILPMTGAITCWTPAADSEAYAQTKDFWGGDAIYAKIVEYSTQVPTNNTSPYYYDGRDAIGTQIQNIINGTDVATALQDAQSEVEFTMQ